MKTLTKKQSSGFWRVYTEGVWLYGNLNKKFNLVSGMCIASFVFESHADLFMAALVKAEINA